MLNTSTMKYIKFEATICVGLSLLHQSNQDFEYSRKSREQITEVKVTDTPIRQYGKIFSWYGIPWNQSFSKKLHTMPAAKIVAASKYSRRVMASSSYRFSFLPIILDFLSSKGTCNTPAPSPVPGFDVAAWSSSILFFLWNLARNMPPRIKKIPA